MTREFYFILQEINGCANKEIITNSQISTLFVVGEKHMQVISRTKLMMREFFMQIFFKHHLFALVLKLGTIMSQ
jgi:hypothetical protein